MELTFTAVLMERRRGVWEASIPWARPLAEPVRAPHRTAAEEELVHRLVDVLGGALPYSDLDALVAPDSIFASPLEVEVERERPDEPPLHMRGIVPIVAGQLGTDLYHAWIPTAPGVCVAASGYAEVYTTVEAWAAEWADQKDADDLEAIECGETLTVSEIEVEIPNSPGLERDETPARLERPETLHEVATNLTHLAAEGTTQRAWERDAVVDTLVDVVTASEPNHICLVGPPGCGKSAIIEEAVRRAYELQNAYQKRHDVWRTSGDQMVAGMRLVGQWQNRAAAVCDELARRSDVLVIDDILGFVEAGPRKAQSNLARFFEPEMSRRSFAVLAEATERTLDTARSSAPGFVESFRLIHVPPTDRRTTFRVANAYVREVESREAAAFTPDAIEAAVEWSDRYFGGQAFPGKAIRLLRSCLREARRRRSEESAADKSVEVDVDFVAEVIHAETGLPRRILLADEGRDPSQVRESFEVEVFGQPAATETISRLVTAIEQGLCNPQHPLASLLLIGPSGVGKTESAKTLASEVYGSRERLIRFDMSEFSEPGTATRLIGTPADPEGELTGRVRSEPHSVLLFDEIEKAHRGVLDLLLQVLGEGRLSDANGRTVDFTNTVVAMTSNLGADREGREPGFRREREDERERALRYRREAEEFFRPEFFNRIDCVVPYRPLDRETLRRIARTTLDDLLERRGLRQPRIMVDVAPSLVEHVITGAVDRRYGARTLKQRIERELLTPLAHQMTRQEAGDELTRVRIVPADDGGIDLEIRAIEPATAISNPAAERRRPPGDVGELESRIDDVLSRLEETLQSNALAVIDARHEELLRAFNVGDEGSPADDRAEQLRQLEIVRQQRRELSSRIRGLFGERAPEEPELPDLSDFDRSRLHEWGRTLEELGWHLTWLRTQIRSLTGRAFESASLLVKGLSGPTLPLLERWRQIVDAFAAGWEIDVVAAIRSRGEWVEHSGPLEGHSVGGILFSGEHPGLGALFETLSGYVWAPKPPTHGRHALALARSWNEGTSDQGALLAMLEEGLPEVEGELDHVEFELGDDVVRDLRFDSSHSFPDSRGEALRAFTDELVFPRLRALDAEAGPLEQSDDEPTEDDNPRGREAT